MFLCSTMVTIFINFMSQIALKIKKSQYSDSIQAKSQIRCHLTFLQTKSSQLIICQN